MGPQRNVWGTASQISSERHRWEKAVITFRTWTTVEKALKKKIIMVFEPIYLEILNNKMVGFANTTAREKIVHIFLCYGSITSEDLEHTFENVRKARDPQKPVKSLLK
jgi:hypothetical protein